METCFNWCEQGYCWMSSDERKWINAIRKLAEKRPDECVILKEPELNGGFIYAKFPQKWVRVRPPREMAPDDPRRFNFQKNVPQIG